MSRREEPASEEGAWWWRWGGRRRRSDLERRTVQTDDLDPGCPSELSRGAKALNLHLQQRYWTHRRVESVTFLNSGETRRRISWDFTVPPEWAIKVEPDRVAVPLTTLVKKPLKQLDVVDATGNPVPVWGREHNGELATALLESPVAKLQGFEVTAEQRKILSRIVHAGGREHAQRDLEALKKQVPPGSDPESSGRLAALLAVAGDLADNFLFVVELPESVVGARTIVKMSYEDDLDRGESHSAWWTKHEATIAGGAWTSACSWHLEINAPEGLAVSDLSYESWDENDDIVSYGLADSKGHTAHIAGSGDGLGSASEARLTLSPASAGLVNQTLAGSFAAFVLLTLAVLGDDHLARVSADADRAGAVAGVTLAAPAFFLALLSRGQEHRLVSRLLLAPRAAILCSALVLFVGAAAIVLDVGSDHLSMALKALWVLQVAVTIWAVSIRRSSVGPYD